MTSRKLDVASLTVVEYEAGKVTQQMQSWIHNKKIPYAEGCARQIIYGFTEDFETFPAECGVAVLRDDKAYAHLLDLVCGLKSKRTCETHVRNQFFDRWNKFVEKDPINARQYQTLISQIKKDSNFVLEKILQKFQTQTNVHSVRDLSALKSGDRVLLIADLNDKGHLSGVSENLLKVCESKQKQQNHKNFITVIHPDNSSFEIIKAKVQWLEGKNVLRSGISFDSFENIAQAFETDDQIYVALTMGKNPEADQYIINCWQSRVRGDNFLTHIQGREDDIGLSTTLWAEAGLDNYISPEDIRVELARRGAANNNILQEAFKANAACGTLRLEDQVPRQVLFDPACNSIVFPAA
ncbi:MAG: hypothetical protein ACT4OY_00925 [Alphaproteobacteria bacterium]